MSWETMWQVEKYFGILRSGLYSNTRRVFGFVFGLFVLRLRMLRIYVFMLTVFLAK